MAEATNMVEVFKNEEFGEIRTLIEGDKVLFCASDVAKALGYANPRDSINRHCKADGVVKRDGVSKTTNQHGVTTEQITELKFINEGNVYRLIAHSKLPSAEKFERWVFDEVLPTIRKTGSYSIERKPDSYMIDDPIQRAQRWIEEETERQQLRDKIEVDKPLVEFADHVSNASNLIDIGTLAKIARDEHIDMGRTRLFDWLRDNGYLMSSPGSKNQPYQKYIEQGLFKVREYTYKTPYGDKVATKTMVTGKGQMFFIEKLRKLSATTENQD